MLLRDHIARALVYRFCATPLEVGDTIGEDKFRVLAILRDFERSGLAFCSFPFARESDRVAADSNCYFPSLDLIHEHTPKCDLFF